MGSRGCARHCPPRAIAHLAYLDRAHYETGIAVDPDLIRRVRLIPHKIEGVSIPAEYGRPRPGDVRHSQADTTAAVRDLGHAPRFTLEESLRRTLEWYRRSS